MGVCMTKTTLVSGMGLLAGATIYRVRLRSGKRPLRPRNPPGRIFGQ